MLVRVLGLVMQFSTAPATTESSTRSGSSSPVSCCLQGYMVTWLLVEQGLECEDVRSIV